MDASVTDGANPTTFILGTDPIAVEMQTIKMMRINKSRDYSVDAMPTYLQAAAGIKGKLDGNTYNIGIIDESAMDIRRVINDVVATTHRLTPRQSAASLSLSVHSPAGAGVTFFEATIPYRTNSTATIEIVSPSGVKVKKITVPIKGFRNQCSWNQTAESNRRCAKSTYVARLTFGKYAKSVSFMVH